MVDRNVYIATETKSNTMRKFLTLAIALLSSPCVMQAQMLRKVLPTSAFSAAVCKVIENFQNNYGSIQGAPLPPEGDRDIFISTVSVPGASRCVIYRFHSVEDTTASWQGTLYTGEDFREAAKIYKSTYKHLQQSTFNEAGAQNGLEGEFIQPTESLRFTTSILRPAKESTIYKNFIAEVEMVNTLDGWTVQLNLHARKDDDKRYQ